MEDFVWSGNFPAGILGGYGFFSRNTYTISTRETLGTEGSEDALSSQMRR